MHKPDNPTPSLHSHYRSFTATTGRSAPLSGNRYSHPHSSSLLGPLPFATSANPPITVSGRGVLPFRAGAWFRVHATYMPDTARPINRHPSGLSRGTHQSPVLMSSHALRHVISGSLLFVSSNLTLPHHC